MKERDLEDLTNAVKQLVSIQSQLDVVASLVRRILGDAIGEEPKRRGRPPGVRYTDEQKREIAAYAREHGIAQAAEEYGTPVSSVKFWMRQNAAEAEPEPAPKRARKSRAKRGAKKRGAGAGSPEARKQANATLSERQARFRELGGTGPYSRAALDRLEGGYKRREERQAQAS